MEYVGTIKKCPNCGAELQSFTSICPSCGHELNDNRVNESVKDFFERLSDSNSEEDMKNLIENYVVPNTKESILEFYVLAASLIKTNVNPFTAEGKKNARQNEIWRAKLNQLSMKAKIALASDPDGLAKVAMIQKEVDTATAKAKKNKAGVGGIVAIIALALILFFINITGGFIKIPSESFIPAENVTLSGDVAKYLKIGGNGITLYYEKNTENSEPRIVGQLVSQGDIKAELEKQYNDFLSKKKWNANDCTSKLYWALCRFNGDSITITSDIAAQNGAFSAKIDSDGDFYYRPWFDFSSYGLASANHSKKLYKKAVAGVMNAKTCTIDLKVYMDVTNETIKQDLMKEGKYSWDPDVTEHSEASFAIK